MSALVEFSKDAFRIPAGLDKLDLFTVPNRSREGFIAE